MNFPDLHISHGWPSISSHWIDFGYRIDLHVHSARYSQCAQTLDPTVLIARLKENQLHGAVLTEHDQLWPQDALQELNDEAGESLRLYGGVEISSEYGHIVAIGLHDLGDTPVGVSLTRLVAVAREQQAALIYAHPYLAYTGLRLIEPEHPAASGIHAVEVVSSVTRGAVVRQCQALAHRHGWIQVGGSDAHAPETVGIAATLFPFPPKNEQELAQAIISGRCVACARQIAV